MTESPQDALKPAELDCRDVVQQLYEFLDGETSEERRTTIGNHLHDCAHCFEAFDFEAELRLVVRARLAEPCPDSLKAKIKDALADAERSGTH